MRSGRSSPSSRSGSARICSPRSRQRAEAKEMNMIVTLSRLGIRPRMFGGFALILGILLMLAFFALQQIDAIGGTAGDLVTSADGDAGMSRVRVSLMATNRALERFAPTHNQNDRESAHLCGD